MYRKKDTPEVRQAQADFTAAQQTLRDAKATRSQQSCGDARKDLAKKRLLLQGLLQRNI